MGDKPRAELLGALASLYQAREYSDLKVFTTDGTSHAVHRAIVCPRSQPIYDAVHHERWRDGIEGHISLTDDEPEVIRLLLEYMYLLNYDSSTSQPSPHLPSTSTPSETTTSPSPSATSTFFRDPTHYGAIYGASALSAFGGPNANPPQSPYAAQHPLYLHRARTESQLTVHALPLEYHGNFGNSGQQRHGGDRERERDSGPEVSPLATPEPNLVLHARMYAAGRRYGVEGLRALALDKFKMQLTRHWDSPEFGEAIHVVYSTTPAHDKELREAVADVLGWHARLLEKPEIEIAIMEINGLAYELLKRSRRAEPEFMN